MRKNTRKHPLINRNRAHGSCLCIVLPTNSGLLFNKNFQYGLDSERRVLPALPGGFYPKRAPQKRDAQVMSAAAGHYFTAC